jgi:hypothetical protein
MPQLQERPKKPRRPPKDPGESRPGDPGSLRARLIAYNFEIPEPLRASVRAKPPAQKQPKPGHKSIEERTTSQQQPAAAAAKESVVMSNETLTQSTETETPNQSSQPQLPPPAGGRVVDYMRPLSAQSIMADAAERTAAATERMATVAEAAAQPAVVRILPTKAEFISGAKKGAFWATVGTVVTVAGVTAHAAVNRRGWFAPAPKVSTPLPTL